ncbi:homing endonuclease [Rhizobium phage RL38J1]|uniref:Homing endonuclease n=1 Tax=Rhizobium phage RL38J1 TaxID=2663232 RepID=A0A6B9J6J8_9CAUD|nr:homing endonuclease [Rhizobium phage RL38J1]QGZ13901.1 homing endonuclease [Rhizobium phage RL38J1]
MHYGFIYITSCKVNGKRYLGRKKSCPRTDPTYLGSGLAVKSAIKKYGRENFEREIVEYTTKENHVQREKYWLDFYRCAEDPDWYNLSSIAEGSGSNGFTGKRGPDKKKRKKRTPVTDETKRKISESRKNFSEDLKEEINSRKSKKTIVLVDPNGEVHKIEGIGKFCRANQMTYNSIRFLLSGAMKSYKGWTVQNRQTN